MVGTFNFPLWFQHSPQLQEPFVRPGLWFHTKNSFSKPITIKVALIWEVEGNEDIVSGPKMNVGPYVRPDIPLGAVQGPIRAHNGPVDRWTAQPRYGNFNNM